jgi:uncharacterized protein YegL
MLEKISYPSEISSSRRRFVKRIHVFILILFVLAAGAVGGWWWGGRQTAPAVVTPFSARGAASPFTERAHYADVVLLLDQSGSMSVGQSATDPMQLRVAGGLAFIDFLAARATPAQRIRFGMVNFGSRVAESCLPLTPVSQLQGAQAALARQALQPMNLGDTNILAALRKANSLFAASRKGATRVVVLFTDGEPDDARKLKLPKYFDELQAYVRHEMQAEIFVLGIDARGKKWSATIPYWLRFVPADHLIRVGSMQEMKTAFNSVAARLSHMPAGVETAVTPAAPVTFTVPPYQERLECYIFSDTANYSLAIRRPDGTVLKPGVDPDCPAVRRNLASDGITVRDPAPGAWSYLVEGDRPVRVVRNCIPAHPHLLLPARHHPAGKPLTVVAAFRKTDGTPLAPDPAQPLQLVAEVKGPGDLVPRAFTVNGADMPRGLARIPDIPLTSNTSGTLALTLKSLVSGKKMTERTYVFPVRSTPYLKTPPEGIRAKKGGKKMAVESQVMQDGKPLPPEQTKALMKDHQAVAQVYDKAKGQVTAAAPMKPAENTLTAELPAPQEHPDTQMVVTTLSKKPDAAAKQLAEAAKAKKREAGKEAGTSEDAKQEEPAGVDNTPDETEKQGTSDDAQGEKAQQDPQDPQAGKDDKDASDDAGTGAEPTGRGAVKPMAANLDNAAEAFDAEGQPVAQDTTTTAIPTGLMPGGGAPPLLPTPSPTPGGGARPRPGTSTRPLDSGMSWGQTLLMGLGILAGLTLLVLAALYGRAVLDTFSDLFTFIGGRTVYYWSEQQAHPTALEIDYRGTGDIESLWLTVRYEGGGHYSIIGQAENVLFNHDDERVEILAFQNTIEVIAAISPKKKVRVRFAAQQRDITRPEHYTGDTNTMLEADWNCDYTT